MASVNPEFGMTLAGHLNQSCFFCRATVKLCCNYHGSCRSKMSELDLTLAAIHDTGAIIGHNIDFTRAKQ